jgi:hypothetical protein
MTLRSARSSLRRAQPNLQNLRDTTRAPFAEARRPTAEPATLLGLLGRRTLEEGQAGFEQIAGRG